MIVLFPKGPSKAMGLMSVVHRHLRGNNIKVEQRVQELNLVKSR